MYVNLSSDQLKKFDRWLALWVSTEVAKSRSQHAYWPNQTKEVIYNAEKVFDWLQGIEPDDILNIDDDEDDADDED